MRLRVAGGGVRLSLAWVVVVGAVALAASYPSPANAATTVQNNQDSGAGSLRDAIASSSSGDTIVIPANISTITLTTGDLVVNHSLTITGAGAATTIIDGNNTSRIFNIEAGTLTLSGVTLQHGNSMGGLGGAILVNNTASLALSQSVVANNTASGDSNGGGIELLAVTATISSTTFSHNAATDDGGAIRLGAETATLTLANSTLTGNTAVCEGGGVSISTGATATLLNDTVNANTGAAGRGGGLDDGAISTTCEGSASQTASGSGNTNGEPAPTVTPAQAPLAATISNTIVSGNSPENCNTTEFGPGTKDLEQGTSCGFSPNPNSDPKLGTLQVNPGPNPVPTEALLAGSPAIDAADNATCQSAPVNSVDERGLPRFPSGDPVCDIGAFEVQPTPAAVIPTAAFTG